MPKFKVWVSKAYYMNGEIEVEADDAEHAWTVADEQIGDFEAQLDYNPGDNRIEVEGEIREDGTVDEYL